MHWLKLSLISSFIILVFVCNQSRASEYLIIGGNASLSLSQQAAKNLGRSLAEATIDRFNDGEVNIKVDESVRGKSVYIIQSIAKSKGRSVNDNLVELYLMIRTLRRANAGTITAIVPYYGYGRQDRKMESRVPISASDVAAILENSGVDRVVALDLHAGQIQGFFYNVPVDNIYGSIFMAPSFAKLKLNNPVIVSPDAGGVARAKKFRETLADHGMETDFAMIIKQRSQAGVVDKANLIGEVKGRDAIIVDDICDTGGTLVKAAEELKKFGANKIYASITHPVFSKDAIKKIENSDFDKVYVANTINFKPGNYKKIEQISIAPLLSMIISKLDNGDSLSDLFLPSKSYIDDYGLSKVVPVSRNFPKFSRSLRPKVASDLQKVEVLLASSSSLKLSAAREIFQKKLQVASSKLRVKGIDCDSQVPEQPIGLEQAREGASNRINSLKAKTGQNLKPWQYIMAIENFVVECKTSNKACDHALVVLEDAKGRRFSYLSPGVEIAAELYDKVKGEQSITVGQLLASKYAIAANDWHGYVTDNKLSRLSQIVAAMQ